MSRRNDGTFRCGRCGDGIGNAGIDRCAIIADLDPDAPTVIRSLHLCNTCRPEVLTTAALANYYETRTP